MTIRVDKCITFGVMKPTTKSIQYQSKLWGQANAYDCVQVGGGGLTHESTYAKQKVLFLHTS